MRPTPPSAAPAAGSDPAYRADLDGLRGYAVAIAVLFHYGLNVPGGFVGPEIFFVISGYLIGGIVFRAVDAGSFSFARFLEFRIRRVAPAALAVILFCLAAGYLILLPHQFGRLAGSALANLYFGANHLFLSQAGYFDISSEFKPLLHTWSLSVEEQFYFLFPLVAVLLTRLAGMSRRVWLLAFMVALFGVNLLLTREHPDAAYFLAIGRAWEFLLGVLLVLWKAPAWSMRMRDIVCAAGVAVLIACTWLYDRNVAYPGFAVLAPSLATAAIIRAGMGGQGHISRWIGTGPQRVLGLISYSFYLWHWPVLVFMQHLVVAPLPQSYRWGAFFLSLAIAGLSWRVVEQPFRARAGMPRRRLHGWIGGGALLVLVVSLLVTQNEGLPQRWQEDPALVAVEKAYFRADACYLNTGSPIEMRDPQTCRRGAPGAPVQILLWGDSHARHWLAALDVGAKHHGIGMAAATAAACPPVLDFDPSDRHGCGAANQRTMDWLAAHPEVHTVVLGARWSRYVHAPEFVVQLDKTLAALKAAGREVVLIGPTPSYHKPVPAALARLDRTEGLQAEVRLPETYTWQALDLFVFGQRFDGRGLTVLDPWPLLCEADTCLVRERGEPVYFDETHLTDAASARRSRLFDPLLAPLQADGDDEDRGIEMLSRPSAH